MDKLAISQTAAAAGGHTVFAYRVLRGKASELCHG